MKNTVVRLFLVAGALAFLPGLAGATDISGTISTTLTITEKSRLVGDVTCTVTANPCIKFGASHIKLDLNSHVMTGNANYPFFSCTLVSGEDGISTDSFDFVSIEGSGLVRLFRGNGITVSGTHTMVEQVAITDTCESGILLSGSDNVLQDNSVAKTGLSKETVGGFGFTGLSASGTGHHIRRNEVIGSGLHGISNDNALTPLSDSEIRENNLSGNGLGGIALLHGSTGNDIESNDILGNDYWDIDTSNAAGANDWQGNLCLGLSAENGADAPKCPNLPAIEGHKNPHGGGND